MILGHAFPPVIEAVAAAAALGTSFGACTEAETEMAEAVRDCIPSVEKVRLVCSGTEATMSAARLARGYTGREKIVKFRGCYHGHGDSFLIQAGSGAMTFGNPSAPASPRVAPRIPCWPITTTSESVRALFKACGDEIAAIIVEPVAANMGVLVPEARIPARPARPVRRAQDPAHLRRGHHGIPARAWAARRAFTASRPT